MFYLPKILFLEKGGKFYVVSDGRTTQQLDLVEYIHCARKSVGYSAFGMEFHYAPQMCNNPQMEALLFSVSDLLPNKQFSDQSDEPQKSQTEASDP